jgi:hypothetical protein
VARAGWGVGGSGLGGMWCWGPSVSGSGLGGRAAGSAAEILVWRSGPHVSMIELVVLRIQIHFRGSKSGQMENW